MAYIPSHITMTFHNTAPVLKHAGGALWLDIEAGQIRATVFLSVEQAHQLATDLFETVRAKEEPTGALEAF